jgi:hypothetical protein
LRFLVEIKKDDLQGKRNNKNLKFYIGYAHDYRSALNAVVSCHFIFHATALK